MFGLWEFHAVVCLAGLVRSAHTQQQITQQHRFFCAEPSGRTQLGDRHLNKADVIARHRLDATSDGQIRHVPGVQADPRGGQLVGDHIANLHILVRRIHPLGRREGFHKLHHRLTCRIQLPSLQHRPDALKRQSDPVRPAQAAGVQVLEQIQRPGRVDVHRRNRFWCGFGEPRQYRPCLCLPSSRQLRIGGAVGSGGEAVSHRQQGAAAPQCVVHLGRRYFRPGERQEKLAELEAARLDGLTVPGSPPSCLANQHVER